jgi:hypothetical protein
MSDLLVKISLPFPYPVHPFLVGQLTAMFHIEVPYCEFELQVPLIPSVLEERSRSWFVRDIYTYFLLPL